MRPVHRRPPASRAGAALRAAAIVLAAGRSQRMQSGNKLLAPVEGKPMVRHVVETALASAAGEVLVVLGHEADAVGAVLSDLKIRTVGNSEYAAGMASSLEAGLMAADAAAEAVIFLLGDMPYLRAETLDALIEGLARSPQADAAVPVHEGRRGNPVAWRRRRFGELMALTGDRGAKPVLERLDDDQVVEVVVDDPGVLIDIDTPAALDEAGRRGL